MAQFAFNFRTVKDLSGWTSVDNMDASLVTVDGEQGLRVTEKTTVSQGLLLLDAAGNDIWSADIIVLVRRDYASNANERQGGGVVRATGTSVANISAYGLGPSDIQEMRLVRYTGGTTRSLVSKVVTGIPGNEWQYQRLYINEDTSPRELFAKAWTGALADEPETPQINIPSIDPFELNSAGGVGIGTLIQDPSRQSFIREIYIGTHGDEAPRSFDVSAEPFLLRHNPRTNKVIPVLSSPTVTDIGATCVRPRVTKGY